MNDVTFRQLNVYDVEDIRRLWEKVADEVYGTSQGIHFQDFSSIEQMYIQGENSFIVGVIDVKKKKLVGTTAVKTYIDTKSKTPSFQIAELSRHFILKEYRKKSLGPKMLQKAESVAKDLQYSAMYLESSETRPKLLDYYFRQGYRVFKVDDQGNAHLLKGLR